MTRIQKGSKFNLSNLLGKTREENDLRMKVLRYVMAVGFVLSPWLGGEAYAEGNGIVRAGTDKPNLIGYDGVANVANIYAEKAANGVGLNAFKHFELGNNQIANMYFKTSPTDTNTLHTLVNTVENQISISGTVNAIRNNEVGGNLYFLSPNGMVVGAGGVINAGSLTMITSGKTFYDTKGALDPAAAAAAVSANNWTLDSTAPISIQGQINTAGGIDLRAVSISMSKSTTKGDVAPALKTGMVFEQVVNTQGLNTYKAKAEERLTAAEVNGEIKLYTKYDSANSENSGKIALSDGAVDAVGNVYIEADRAAAMVSADIDASGNIEIIANRNRSNGDDIGEVTLVNSDVYAGGNINIVADKSINLQSTIIQAGGTIDFASKWYQNDYSPYTHGGTLTVDGGSISANGYIYADAGKKIEIKNGGSITSDSELTIQCLANGGSSDYYSELVLTGGTVSGNEVKIDVDDKIVVNKGASIASTVKMNVNVEQGEIVNKGSIIGAGIVNLQSQHKDNTSNGNINNEGIIESTGGTLKLTANDNLTNTGTIQAKDQITFEVANTITNRGDIVSTYSNVQAHIGRDFYNLAKSDTKYGSGVSSAKDGRIIAGGNVQVDYPLERPASQNGTYGIYNSGLIQANGNSAPESEGGVVDKETGSGNIWLTSSYNITNYGTMEAGRQITLNARDFLHNYGLIQGVTYLDIKSIMGYVYNHTSGEIISTGGNIDLSSGQANLEIKNDTDGKKKEEYRKFTPIIIEGLVQATSDDDRSNQTRKGNIEITAYLGDIYINGGTIKTKPELGTNGEVKEVAGNVILDAAQNITIGFQTVKVWGDDPTTDAEDNREYYINTTPSQKAAKINGTEIALTSGSGKTISMSEVNNTLTASKAITINTNSMDIVGGTFNADTLKATLAEGGALSITGGTINAANVNSNRNMIINGGAINTGTAQGSLSANNISMESGSVTGKDVTIAADKQVQLNGGSITAQAEGAGKLTVTAATNLVHDGATIVADNAAFSAGNKIDLQSGSLNAKGAAFGVTNGTAGANSIVESGSDYSLSAGSLSLSANQGNIILNGTSNVLQGVTLANVGGNIAIVNGNDRKALTIATAEGTSVSGTINVTNNGEGITIEGIHATNNVSLTADKGIAVTGTLTTTGDVSLDADEGISIAGDVNATTATFNAGQDFVQNGGAITASGAVVTAGRDVKLNAGSMEASTSASLTAGNAASVAADHGYISEGTGYALIAPQVTASAVGAITLDSSANQLENINVNKVVGNLAIGSGNSTSTEALQVNIGQGITVDGSLTIKNYKIDGDDSANDIVVAGTLDANNITITNAEANINAGTGAVISADSIDLHANSGAIKVDGTATITAENNGTFAANAQDINIAGGQITADTVTLTAANAINQTAGSIVATTTVASAGTDLSLASKANKLQNVTVGAQNGNATIASGNDAGVALKVQTYGTVGGNLSIDSKSDIVSDGTISAAGDVTMTAGDKVTINSGTINANSVTANAANLLVNGGTINVNTLVASKGLNIANDTQNTAVTNITANSITAGGSIGITGGDVVTTSVAADEALNITGGTVSSNGAISLSGATGVTIGSAAAITTGNNLTISSSGGAVENNHILDITTGSVTLSGSGGVTNKAGITARDNVVLNSTAGAVTNSGVLSGGQDVAISSTYGKIDNQGKITAGRDLSMSSTTGAITNSAAIQTTNGIVELSGSGITNNAAINTAGSVVLSGTNSIANDAGITAGQGIEMTSTAGTISNGAGLTAKGGSVALKGNKDITNNGRIQANRNVSIISEEGKVTNNAGLAAGVDFGATVQAVALFRVRSLVEDSGSVTISGKDDVVNTGNGIISATQNVSMSSTTGNVENSGTIAADQSVGMTADAGTVKNSNTVSADTGTVTMSGKTGVVNDNKSATISAGSGVSMTSSAEGVTNYSTVTSTSGVVEMDGQKTVKNTGAVTATGGSVEISGSEVSNKGAVTASGGSVTMSGNGGVTNNADISARDSVSMTSEQGTVDNSNTVSAGTGTVTMSGKMGVVNDNTGAIISAGSGVSMTSSAGAVDNSNAITVSNGSVTMTGQTSVKNEGELKATGGSVEISGNGGVTNGANITANENVNISADAGAITNSGSVTANTGDISLKSDKGITSTDSGASLKTESLNGSISAATTYGEVNISEINAGKTASASSQNGSVIIGSVSGNDVVLSSGASSSGGSGDGSEGGSGGSSEGGSVVTSPSIEVGTAKVDNSLKLQGDNIKVYNVASSNPTGNNTLTVDVNGAGGSDTAVQGSLDLNIAGDVVFDNLNVKNANVTASGNIDVNKLGVDDKGQAQLTSNKNPENENGTTVTVVGKDATPDAGSGNVIVAPGNDSDTWLNIKMDEEGSKTTVVDDAGRDVNNKDYPAQMSAKLVDYDPYDTYLEHYADMADIFSRSYLIDAPERSSSDILFSAQGGRVVLKQDANGLHLEISEEEQEA